MANKKNKFLQQQKLAIGAIVAIAVAVVIYFSTLVVTDVPDGEFAEGRHYMKLEEPGKVRGKKDVVMEFFSYGCIHCFNFDPEIERLYSAANCGDCMVRPTTRCKRLGFSRSTTSSSSPIYTPLGETSLHWIPSRHGLKVGEPQRQNSDWPSNRKT
jgi:hypothetical protein